MNNTNYKNAGKEVFGILCGSLIVGKVLEKLGRCNKCCFNKRRFEEYNGQEHDNNGYNQSGLDKEKHDRRYYVKNIKQFRHRLDEAYQQLQQGQFRYALYDAYAVMGETIKLIVQYTNGSDDICENLLMNMKISEREHLLGEDMEFINRLYEVYHICECAGREFTLKENINHSKVYFVIMQIKDLLNFAETTIASS